MDFVQNSKEASDEEPVRAEALIAEIYAQLLKQREKGRKPERIFLCAQHYKIIKAYQAKLGSLDTPAFDYLGEYDLFGLEFYVSDAEWPEVI